MLNEDKRIKTKQQLREYLAAETDRYDNAGLQKLLIFFIIKTVQEIIAFRKFNKFLFADVKFLTHLADFFQFSICSSKTKNVFYCDVWVDF